MSISARFSDLPEWFSVWLDDKRSLLATMRRNLAADLEAGRDYFGESACRQRAEIDAYVAKFEAEMDGFDGMLPEQVNHWCFRDLKRRGAID